MTGGHLLAIKHSETALARAHSAKEGGQRINIEEKNAALYLRDKSLLRPSRDAVLDTVASRGQFEPL
jgi:hypothetical protein